MAKVATSGRSMGRLMARVIMRLAMAVLVLAVTCSLALYTSVSSAVDGPAVMISYLSYSTPLTDGRDADEKLMQSFNAASMNYTVVRREYNILPGFANSVNSLQDSLPWFQAVIGFDVVTVLFTSTKADFTARWHDLGSVWADLRLQAVVPPAVASFCQDDSGVFRFLPTGGVLFMVNYRQSEFDELGLVPPRTVAELRAICQAFAVRGRKCFSTNSRRGASQISLNLFDLVALRLYGADFLIGLQEGSVSFVDARVTRVVAELVALRQAGLLDLRGTLPDTPAGWSQSSQDFVERRAALFLGYDAVRPTMTNLSDRADVRAFVWPAPVENSTTLGVLAGIGRLGLPVNGLNKAGAFAFAKFLAGPEAANLIYNNSARASLLFTVNMSLLTGFHPDPIMEFEKATLAMASSLALETFNVMSMRNTLAAFSDPDGLAELLLSVDEAADDTLMARWAALAGQLEDLRVVEALKRTSVPRPVSVLPGTYDTDTITIEFFSSSPNAAIFLALSKTSASSANGSVADLLFMETALIRLHGVGRHVVSAFATSDLLAQSDVVRFVYDLTERQANNGTTSRPSVTQRLARARVTAGAVAGIVVGLLAAIACVGAVVVLGLLQRRWYNKSDSITMHSTSVLSPEDITLVRLIGSGASSCVYAGRLRGSDVAVKVIGEPLTSSSFAAEQPTLVTQAPVLLPNGALLVTLRSGLARRPSGCRARCCPWLESGSARVEPEQLDSSGEDEDDTTSAPDDENDLQGSPPDAVRSLSAAWLSGTKTADSSGTATQQLGSGHSAIDRVPRMLRSFVRECAIILSLRHRHIVLGMGFTVYPRLAIVQEFMERGSLFDILSPRSSASDRLASVQLATWAHHVSSGMAYLHASGIVHGDLKSLNVLISQDNIAKLCDFGISRKVGMLRRFEDTLLGDHGGGGGARRCGRRRGRRRAVLDGTTLWAAPELLAGKRPSMQSDIYAFSIVAWELYAVARPYAGVHPAAVAVGVSEGLVRPAIELVRPELRSLASALLPRLWAQNPAERLAMADVEKMLRQVSLYADSAGSFSLETDSTGTRLSTSRAGAITTMSSSLRTFGAPSTTLADVPETSRSDDVATLD